MGQDKGEVVDGTILHCVGDYMGDYISDQGRYCVEIDDTGTARIFHVDGIEWRRVTMCSTSLYPEATANSTDGWRPLHPSRSHVQDLSLMILLDYTDSLTDLILARAYYKRFHREMLADLVSWTSFTITDEEIDAWLVMQALDR